MVDSSKVTAFITALTNKFENKVANKKDSITGDFSSDSASYPTVKAVKNFFGSKIASWSSTPSDSNYPSEKLVKNSLDGKVNISQGTTNNGKFLKVSSGNVICESVTIPSASATTPSADVSNGAVGSSSNYAKADHQHPLSSAYATSGHNHDSDYISKGTGTNIVLANGTNIAQSTFATSGHNHSGTYAPASHNQASSTITNATAFNNIKSGESTTLTLTDQAKINSAINDKLGVLEGLKFIEITTDKGTASASTMNKLYIENKNSKTDIYYTKQSGSSYSWVKMEDNILEDISIPIVYDGLDSDDSTKALSAKQGKALNTDKISKVANNTNILLANGTNIAQSTFSASGHTHNYTTTSDVDTEIEAYLDAITTALTS